MPKRSCPFTETNLRQTKIHVSNREVHKNDEEYMSEVYAKTREKLYQGANNNNNNVTNSGNSPELELCEKCNTLQETGGKCWFCEIRLCTSCISMCTNCCEWFCSRCCFSVSSGSTHICLTCYG